MRNWTQYVRGNLRLPELTPEREARVVRELASQLEDFYRDALARGLGESEADAHARAQVRNWEHLADQVQSADAAHASTRLQKVAGRVEESARRKGGRWNMFADVVQDVRYGLRQLRRNPGFTAVAILALALGIGVNTAVFSFADALLLRPLPVQNPQELFSFFHTTQDGNYSSFSFPDYLDLRDRSDALAGLAAYSDVELELGDASESEKVPAAIVSGNYFDVLGVKPVVGRAFLPEEDQVPGTHPVAVISHALWQRRFGADPNLPGRTVPLNGHTFTIVGVAPRGFRSTEVYSVPDVWVPLMTHRQTMPTFRAFGIELFGNRGTHWLNLVGRLGPGVSRPQALADAQTVAAWQAKSFPETNKGWDVLLVPASDARLGSPTGGTVAELTKLLMAVVGLVLLIACANVANMFLARSVTRQREMGIRLGLGASRIRIARQLITESLLVSLLGGAAGLLLAGWTRSLLSTFEVVTLLPGIDVQLDARVLGFALGVSLLTGVLFGLAPAVQSSGVRVVQALKEAGRTPRRGRRLAMRHVLVAAQVALSLVLLVGTGLLLKTLRNLQGLDLGFDAEKTMVVTLDSPQGWARYSTSSEGFTEAEGRMLYARLLERVQALPEVESASIAFTTPFSGWRMANDIFPAEGERTNVDMNVVGTGYFRTLGIPLLRGRDFTEQDHDGAPRVAIVNEAMAALLWPGQDPIGKQFRMYDPAGPGPMLEIVGVAGNGRYYRSWRSNRRPFVFLPFAQMYMASMTLQIRHTGAVGSISRGVRTELPRLDRRLKVRKIQTTQEAMAGAIVLERMAARLLGVFGAVALVLASIGVYGAVSFSVSQRTHEMGIRMALGARKQDVFRLVTTQSALPLLAGTVLGWAAAWGLARFVSRLLYGVSPTDVATFAGAALVLVAAGLAAVVVPARRATQVDPLVAIRYE